MKYKIIQLFIICLFLFTVPSAQAERTQEILIVGDSLSAAYGIAIKEGWASLLDDRLKNADKKWRVRNASISGSTTGNGIVMLNKALALGQPEIVLIALGANDGLRGFPIPLLQGNLRKLIAIAKDAGARVLLVQIELPTNYGNQYTSAFHHAYGQIAQEEKVTLLPFLLAAVYDNSALIQEDGLHPTADAQPYILNTLWPSIQQAIEE